jgi:ParB/RepB/Spo0J family partition protein
MTKRRKKIKQIGFEGIENAIMNATDSTPTNPSTLESNEIKDDKVFSFDLSDVRPSPWADRVIDGLTLNNPELKAFVDDLNTRGQQMPAVVRKVSGFDQNYELVGGHKRFWALNQLLQQNESIQIKAVIRELDDKAAFEYMALDTASQDRKSELEKAFAIQAAIEQSIYKNWSDAANAYGVSRAYMSKLKRTITIKNYQQLWQLVAPYSNFVSFNVVNKWLKLLDAVSSSEQKILLEKLKDINVNGFDFNQLNLDIIELLQAKVEKETATWQALNHDKTLSFKQSKKDVQFKIRLSDSQNIEEVIEQIREKLLARE